VPNRPGGYAFIAGLVLILFSLLIGGMGVGCSRQSAAEAAMRSHIQNSILKRRGLRQAAQMSTPMETGTSAAVPRTWMRRETEPLLLLRLNVPWEAGFQETGAVCH
jgi:hypothetical protein